MIDLSILEHNIDRSINYYVETAFANDVLYSLDKISPSMIAYFSMFNASFIEQKIYDVKITFSLNKHFYSILNETSIEFYNKRGIDPYNKSNEAFTEVCYRSINFEYDLTQEYRREIIYSGDSITSISPNCTYLNLSEKRFILFCEEINGDNYNIGYETIFKPLNKRKVENLPMCEKILRN